MFFMELRVVQWFWARLTGTDKQGKHAPSRGSQDQAAGRPVSGLQAARPLRALSPVLKAPSEANALPHNAVQRTRQSDNLKQIGRLYRYHPSGSNTRGLVTRPAPPYTKMCMRDGSAPYGSVLMQEEMYVHGAWSYMED